MADSRLSNHFPDALEIEDTVRIWLTNFKQNLFTKQNLRHFWRDCVPLIYSPKPNCDCLNLTYDEATAKIVLYDALEKFICDGPPEEVFERLRIAEKPPTLCGHVFKMGEPTYSCRDCGTDPTCVLCVDCFRTSAHKNHRYKMSTSGGGGYCDCGDSEAWKFSHSCDRHLKSSLQEVADNPLELLPQDLVARAKLVFETTLDYCYELLTWEKSVDLPLDLQTPTSYSADTYTTMLFNDEVHTYEQVISTLVRAIQCSQKEAIEYATMIDREGRSIVRCGPMANCSQVKIVIEKQTSRQNNKPLKVNVMHTNVVSHQVFAVKLLVWLQQLIEKVRGFRLLLSKIMTVPYGDSISLLEYVLQSDTQMWKAVRTNWHQLFICGMLMELDTKRDFAQVFTKMYKAIMQDFISDDHEHTLSVTSLSVQIFTVPTLAHYLIMKEDVLAVLLYTFCIECEKKLNSDRKLAFERNQPNAAFRRAHFILVDLKYLLSSKPERWNESLRKNFMRGFNKMLSLLSWMQGMDASVRQVGQHMEFEPEWESAFSLHSKLASVISLIIEWCATDRLVLVKAYRTTLRSLEPCLDQTKVVSREVANHSASCVEYDVATQPVSIHLPLSRLLAGLHLHLDKYKLSFDSSEFNEINRKPGPVQIMELPLRAQVMVAQVHASMWRRNGYSLINQIYFYHNVRWRSEMYDRDVNLLQMGAALIESNEFLIHLLNKFNLIGWAKEEYELGPLKSEDDGVRQIITLAEEFLSLLITIVAERCVPGVGVVSESDQVRKEIIQQLCIESMAHSQLVKMLPEDNNHETGIEAVIGQVATFRRPQGTSKGMFEINAECLLEFNPFFYHYSREEQSKAEEAQLKRKKQVGEEECCPPPVLPPLCPGFTMLLNVLQCDVMLHLMATVLNWCGNQRSRSFSEMQFQKMLHLIGYALNEEERAVRDGDLFFQFTGRAANTGILTQLEVLVGNQKVEAHRVLLNWVLRKFRNVRHLREGADNACSGSGVSPAEDMVTSTDDDALQLEKKKRAEIAAARRARIMAQISAMQKSFIREHAELFENSQGETNLSGSTMDLSDIPDDLYPVCLGLNQTPRTVTTQKFTCILCQEDQEILPFNRTMVLSALVQKSTVLCKQRDKFKLSNKNELENPLFASSALYCAPHTSTCGHVMHSDCWQKYFDSVVAKERRRPARLRNHLSFDIEKQEFLCPLCECLSNTVIPIVPPLSYIQSEINSKVDINLEDWVNTLLISLKKQKGSTDESNSENVDEYSLSPCTMEELCSELPSEVAKLYPKLFQVLDNTDKQPLLPSSLIDMSKLFIQATYTVGLSCNPNSDDSRLPMLSWQSCAYTIHTIEWMLRDQEKSIFEELAARKSDCITALVRFVATSSLVLPQEMLHLACHRALSIFFQEPSSSSCEVSILDLDPFGLLVYSCVALPWIILHNDVSRSDGLSSNVVIPSGGMQEFFILQLVYVMHVVQIILTSTDLHKDSQHNHLPMETDESFESSPDEAIIVIAELYRLIREKTHLPHLVEDVAPTSLLRHIQESSIPFLRCCALYFHSLTGILPPKELQDSTLNEYQSLCKYLGLQQCISSELLSGTLHYMITKWIAHPKVMAEGVNEPSTWIRYPLIVNQLVKLPADYSELINDVSAFTCPNSDGEDSRTPTMCLVCGEMLCSQSYCCQMELDNLLVGACTRHAHFCGAGVGIFLRVRECKVLLLAGRTKGCFVSPPYLDEYGETDQGLRRGNPLRLCLERYKKLQKLWLSHGIPEEIVHALESNTNILTTEWQHL